jgi:hypothetical protein
MVVRSTLILNNNFCFNFSVGDDVGQGSESWKEAYDCGDNLDSILAQKMFYKVEKLGMGEVPRLHLGLDIWFDGFDPNNQSKKNRGSVYIRTATFGPSRSFRNNLQNTYPIAIGPDKCDRSIIDKHVQDGLNKISEKSDNGVRQKFYCSALGTEVEVNVVLVSKLADQPERRKTLGLSGGNSKYHARFGLIADLNKVCQFIRPCDVCMEKIYSGDTEFDKVRCENCTQWNMEGNHPLLRYDIPEEYPREELTDDKKASGMFYPKKVSLVRLSMKMKTAAKKMLDGEWNEKTARCFLKVEGINGEWIKKLVVYCRFRLKLRNVSQEGFKGELT